MPIRPGMAGPGRARATAIPPIPPAMAPRTRAAPTATAAPTPIRPGAGAAAPARPTRTAAPMRTAPAAAGRARGSATATADRARTGPAMAADGAIATTATVAKPAIRRAADGAASGTNNRAGPGRYFFGTERFSRCLLSVTPCPSQGRPCLGEREEVADENDTQAEPSLIFLYRCRHRRRRQHDRPDRA